MAVLVGKNPWQSHGFPRARVVLKEIAKDPERSLIVIDPRRTETAELADIHLQVRPGGDAWLLAAMIAVLLREGLAATEWLAEHATGLEELTALFAPVDVAAYCERAGAQGEVRASGVQGAAGSDGGVALAASSSGSAEDAYPFVLAAGERRSSTANMLFRA